MKITVADKGSEFISAGEVQTVCQAAHNMIQYELALDVLRRYGSIRWVKNA